MFNGIWNFVKRHRKKFIFTGIVAGGIYYCGRYAERKLKEFREQEQNEFILGAKKQQHFLNTQLTCKGTVSSLIGNLRSSLCRIVDVDSFLEELRNKSNNKLEIWEQLKILSLTGAISSIYASCILVLSLKIQMNLISGKMFQKAISTKNLMDRDYFSETFLPTAAQAQYLSKIKDFLNEDLDELVADVKAAVIDSVFGMTLKDPVSVPTLHGIIASVREKIEAKRQNGYHDYIPFSLMHFMKFLGTDDEDEQQKKGESSVRQMNIREKTLEVLNSNDFQATSNICVSWGFNYLVKRFEETLLNQADVSTASTDIEIRAKPLAKVIPILNNEMSLLLSDQPNQFFVELLENTYINNFAMNVYNRACSDDFLIE